MRANPDAKPWEDLSYDLKWLMARESFPMSNPSKQRGTAWETAVVDYMRKHGFPYAERRVTNGR